MEYIIDNIIGDNLEDMKLIFLDLRSRLRINLINIDNKKFKIHIIGADGDVLFLIKKNNITIKLLFNIIKDNLNITNPKLKKINEKSLQIAMNIMQEINIIRERDII